MQSILPHFDQHWRRYSFFLWVATCVFLVYWTWGQIHWLALGDTDDNMRLMEVRAWINGQGWYDLRQYKLNPPEGFNIHWSRLVDIPIAGIILITQPFFGTAIAERAAIAIAPLLPLLVTFYALALTCRRLVAPLSFIVAIALLFSAQSTMGMFTPTRIDHHGWQLAMLAVILAGLADPRQMRSGLTIGIASALSLVIGFELMPYLALAGAAVTLRWVWNAGDSIRLQLYGISLATGSALGYALFASIDNRVPRCDVLSPVWMSVMVLAGALLVLLARLSVHKRTLRFAAAMLAGAIIVGFLAYMWPQCLGKPEGVSPELQHKWLDNIREVRPVYRQEWRTMLQMLALPVIGMIGYVLTLYLNHRNLEKFAAWCSITLVAACGLGLLFFQSRAAPAAQMLAIPGAVSLIWILVPHFRTSGHMLVRVLGVFAVFLVGSGLFIQFAVEAIPKDPVSPRSAAIRKAGAQCSTIPSMAPLNKLPKTTIMTMVDLGPRLITLTHHKALAGPYHRNGDAILDMHHAYDGTPDQARAIARRHGATLLLLCPNFAEGTVYKSRSPKGFYAQMEAGKVPDWLTPVALPKGSPFKLWRIK